MTKSHPHRWRTAAALAVSAAVLTACGGGASDVSGGGASEAETTLRLVAYAVPEPGWSKIIPAFAAEYARLAPDRRSLELGEKENGECVFLLGNECVIHPVKPAQCRAFPDGWRYPGAEEICPACRPGPQKPV